MTVNIKRTVYFYSGKIICFTRARGDDLRGWRCQSPLTLNDHIQSWADIFRAGNAQFSNRSGTYSIYIADMREEENWYIILINYTDSTKGAHIFRDMETGEEETHANEPTVGLNHSCHVLISKQLDPNDHHRILFEKNGPVPFRKVANFISYISRESARDNPTFIAPHPYNGADSNGNIRDIRLEPKLSYNGFVSEDFVSDIQNGTLSEIELITNSVREAGIDASRVPEIKSQILSIRNNVPAGQDAWQYVASWLGIGQQIDYDKLRVCFRNETGASETVNFDVETQGILDEEKYTKKKHFDFVYKPPTSFPRIKNYVVKRMLRLV